MYFIAPLPGPIDRPHRAALTGNVGAGYPVSTSTAISAAKPGRYSRVDAQAIPGATRARGTAQIFLGGPDDRI
jgi:hypothetical protein